MIITNPGGDVLLVRFLHASPEPQNLTFRIGSDVIGTLGFGQATPYLEAPSTSFSLSVTIEGQALPALEQQLSASAGSVITVVVDGPLTTPAIRLVNDLTVVPDSTFANLRILHEASAPGPVDVYLGDALTPLDSLTPVATGLSFRNASGYFDLPVGTYRVRLTPAGTSQVLLDSGNLALAAGEVRTLVVLDDLGGGLPLSLILLEDGPALIRGF